MNCEKCGYKIEKGSFCPNCGNKIERNDMVSNELLVTLKPKYIIGYNTMSNIFILVILLYFILRRGRMISEALSDFNLLIPLLLLILGSIVNEVLTYMKFKKLQYNFYTNRLEYKDGFINIEEKEIKYSSIREVVMSQNIIERLFNIGTIRIYTSASTSYSNRYNSNGIMIHCLSDVKNNYSKIKRIIDTK